MLVEVRAADRDDLAAVADVAAVVDPPDEGADVDLSYYGHLADVGRLVVADAQGIVLGYAAAIPVDGTVHLSDLFVHPDAHGRGIGSALLDAALLEGGLLDPALLDPALLNPAGGDAAGTPRQTFSSLHPSALPLYLRAGMVPRWPLLYLRGDPSGLPPSPLAVRDAGAAELAELERAWIGWERAAELEFWSTRPGARALVVSDRETPVATACVTRTRLRHTLTHLAALDATFLADAVRALGPYGGTDLLMAAPGVSAVVPLLVELGWRIVDCDLYCASEPDLWDATRVVPHPGLL